MLTILLRLLHNPPSPPLLLKSKKEYSDSSFMTSRRPSDVYDPATVIPFPILVQILELADKYALDRTIMETLCRHLLVYAETYPLQIYGYATDHGLDKIAAKASQYLMPVASYRMDEICQISKVNDYHKIVQLQHLRTQSLRELVLGEDIFPHGYRACPLHLQGTTALWNTKRTMLAAQLTAVTDVAVEMGLILEALPKGCQTCHEAGSAAVKMLAVSLHIARGKCML